jgi:hypothetical protein
VTATVYYDNVNEIAHLSFTFLNPPLTGTPADPTTVSCIITEPAGVQVTHTYNGTAPADIMKVMTGKYALSVACSPSVAGVDGLWGFEWVGTGAVSDVQPGTWRVLPAAISQLWYVGLEEMNDRLGITDAVDSSAMQTAIATSAGWINEYCGRHFNRINEARTYQPTNVWLLDIDDLIDDPAIAVAVDQDGDGTYEQPWTRGTDYQLRYGPGRFNPNVMGTGSARPFRQLQVVQSGKWLPFTWPYSHLNRVQVIGPWGWPQVPWQVAEANRILAADLFKMKDAPFGIAGVSDLGVARVQANPWLVENLRAFVNPRHKVGV